jgi:hypothetical protein
MSIIWLSEVTFCGSELKCLVKDQILAGDGSYDKLLVDEVFLYTSETVVNDRHRSK